MFVFRVGGVAAPARLTVDLRFLPALTHWVNEFCRPCRLEFALSEKTAQLQ
jgi:hypothetical protein